MTPIWNALKDESLQFTKFVQAKRSKHIKRNLQELLTTMQPSNEYTEWDAINPGHAKWNDLDGRAKEAAATLGYTQETWNPENWGQGRLVVTSLVKEKSWNDLESPQRDAAKLLAFSQEKWDKLHGLLHQ